MHADHKSSYAGERKNLGNVELGSGKPEDALLSGMSFYGRSKEASSRFVV